MYYLITTGFLHLLCKHFSQVLEAIVIDIPEFRGNLTPKSPGPGRAAVLHLHWHSQRIVGSIHYGTAIK